ncbi:proline-rich receptor-like protein kinase PERK2 isoform X10 [Ursus americanus]|uniref:proline-rich receptor-like protein kinase PERK2 isoform X10 n=1 Tax=Ursus americanus TaxID=9643 RepID=UPI001E67C268|nr:proline-rich receptor-like protein kinase PERK2 isoform X10 [Ursus americanus]
MWNTIYNTLRSRGLKSTRETDHARNLAFLPDSGMIPPPPEVSPRAGRRRPREAVPPPRPFRSPGLSGLRLPATAPTAWPAAPPLPVPRTLQAPFPGNGPNSRSSRHAGRSRPKGAVLAAPAVRRSPRPLRLAGRTPAQPPQAPSGAGLQRRRKVFHKLRLWVSETEIQKVVANTPGAIEPILLALREKVKDGAVQQAPPPTADPGPSSADANSPQAQLTTPAHTGLQGPTVPSGVKTLPSQRTPERTGHFRTQPMGPWSTWIPGCNSYWRKRSRPWSCCRRWSRYPNLDELLS